MTSAVGSPRVGLLLSGDGLSLDEVVAVGVCAEDAGFDSIWHVQIQREPFVPLTAIAARTKRIRLGTGVATWAFQPVLAALMSASLSEISGGRFVLGLGTGPKDWNERYFGMTYDRPVDRMREYVDTVRGVWTAHSGASFDHTGDFYDVRVPAQHRPAPGAHPDLPRGRSEADDRPGGRGRGRRPVQRLHDAEVRRRVRATDTGRGCRRGRAVDRRRRDRRGGYDGGERGWCAGAGWARRHLAFYAVIPYFDVMFRLHGFEQEAAAVRAAAERDDLPGMFAAVTDDMVEAFAIAGTPDRAAPGWPPHEHAVRRALPAELPAGPRRDQGEPRGDPGMLRRMTRSS